VRVAALRREARARLHRLPRLTPARDCGRAPPLAQQRNVISLAARRAPARLGALARELGIDVRASRRRPAGERVPLRSLGLFAGAGISTTSGSYGESRYVVEQHWKRSATTVTAADVNAGSAAFRGLGALIVPDGTDPTGGLDAQGQQHLRDWVAAGGVLVGLRHAHNVARSAGLTSTTVKPTPAGYTVIGSHFRVDVDHASPVALGRPREDFEFNKEDLLLNPSTTGVNVLTYPSDDRFWFNGFTKQADLLKGTAARHSHGSAAPRRRHRCGTSPARSGCPSARRRPTRRWRSCGATRSRLRSSVQAVR
jgi:hypothetical protein